MRVHMLRVTIKMNHYQKRKGRWVAKCQFIVNDDEAFELRDHTP